MDDNFFKKIAITAIILALIVLSFFLLKPILLSIVGGFILAFIFSPIYNLLYKITKKRNVSAAIVCIFLILLILVPLWLFTPAIIDESIKLYRASLQLDLVTPLKNLFPSLFGSQEFSQQVGLITQNFISKMTNSLMNYLSNIILEFPTIIMQIFVIFFILYYALRDKEKMIEYIRGLLPFSKEIEKKLFDSTRDITFSVLYGQLMVGIIQGIILGIGLFIFNAPNALVLSLLGVVAGIFPIIGPSLIGVPVSIFFLIAGNPLSAVGILIFTFISSMSDHLFRPMLVAKRARLHTALVLAGMIGGFLLFGILGFVLGPLILAYLLIIIEVYRNKELPGVLIQDK
jgi:predicted PurR-regulated permease PerM